MASMISVLLANHASAQNNSEVLIVYRLVFRFWKQGGNVWGERALPCMPHTAATPATGAYSFS